MPTYRVQKDCDWKDFAAREGQEIDAADLKTGDGKPLPAEVVAHLTAGKRPALVPVEEPAAETPAAGPITPATAGDNPHQPPDKK